MCYYSGSCELDADLAATTTLWALSYGRDGHQIHKRKLGTIESSHPKLKFAFSPHPEATRFDVAIYFPASKTASTVKFHDINLEMKMSHLK